VSERREAYDVLLFDLGGVVIELGGMPIWQEWTAEPDERAVWERWLRSTAVRRFESGRARPAEFADEIVREFALRVTPQEFLAHFEQWPQRPFPGALELLTELRPRFRLGCLSNCNELHWPRFLGEMGLDAAFDRHFSSHELGLLKPDLEVFDRVVADLGCEPERILFLDDNAINVEAARSAGLQGERVQGPEGVRESLRSRGLLT
jgi:HAD superfamily hydrolase (TIGR01509 family)